MPPAAPTTCFDDGDAEGARAVNHEGARAVNHERAAKPSSPPTLLDDAVAMPGQSTALFDARGEQLLESSAPKARVALDHAPPSATTAATVKIVWAPVKIFDIPSTAATDEANKIVYSMNDTTNEFYDLEKHHAASTAAPVRAIGLQPLGLSACAARADPSDPVVARRTSTCGALTVSYQMLRDT